MERDEGEQILLKKLDDANRDLAHERKIHLGIIEMSKINEERIVELEREFKTKNTEVKKLNKSAKEADSKHEKEMQQLANEFKMYE